MAGHWLNKTPAQLMEEFNHGSADVLDLATIIKCEDEFLLRRVNTQWALPAWNIPATTTRSLLDHILSIPLPTLQILDFVHKEPIRSISGTRRTVVVTMSILRSDKEAAKGVLRPHDFWVNFDPKTYKQASDLWVTDPELKMRLSATSGIRMALDDLRSFDLAQILQEPQQDLRELRCRMIAAEVSKREVQGLDRNRMPSVVLLEPAETPDGIITAVNMKPEAILDMKEIGLVAADIDGAYHKVCGWMMGGSLFLFASHTTLSGLIRRNGRVELEWSDVEAEDMFWGEVGAQGSYRGEPLPLHREQAERVVVA